MSLNRSVITVDGLAGSGKTTLARLLAQRLGFAHLNSGLLYRAVAYLVRQQQIDPNSPQQILDLLKQQSMSLICETNPHTKESVARILIDGVDQTNDLSAPEVSELTSKTAIHDEVRKYLVRFQREAFPGQPLVAEGRDMGTVIFSDAAIKFFIEVNQETRIKRRLLQLYGEAVLNQPERLNQLKPKIEIEIIERDQRDQQRIHSPTVAADDAIKIDNSQQTLTVVVQSMYDAVLSRGLLR